ncbi:uncharacterized protein METZ01_LOCUS337044 [marine metagenome]|uniref:Uncharacterized protein n=1 Tax=marine metagenome TaxID=408172 RepID=A0A382QGY0_9ZZZZ
MNVIDNDNENLKRILETQLLSGS